MANVKNLTKQPQPPNDNSTVDYPEYENTVRNIRQKDGVPFYRDARPGSGYSYLCECRQCEELNMNPFEVAAQLRQLKESERNIKGGDNNAKPVVKAWNVPLQKAKKVINVDDQPDITTPFSDPPAKPYASIASFHKQNSPPPYKHDVRLKANTDQSEMIHYSAILATQTTSLNNSVATFSKQFKVHDSVIESNNKLVFQLTESIKAFMNSVNEFNTATAHLADIIDQNNKMQELTQTRLIALQKTLEDVYPPVKKRRLFDNSKSEDEEFKEKKK